MSDEQLFLLIQVKVIDKYVEQFPDEDPTIVQIRWITKYAAEFRECYNLIMNK